MEITEIVAVASVFIALVSLTVQQYLTRQERKSDAGPLRAESDPERTQGLDGLRHEAPIQSRLTVALKVARLHG